MLIPSCHSQLPRQHEPAYHSHGVVLSPLGEGMSDLRYVLIRPTEGKNQRESGPIVPQTVPAIWFTCVSVRPYLNLTSSPLPFTISFFCDRHSSPLFPASPPSSGSNGVGRSCSCLSRWAPSTWAAGRPYGGGFPREMLDVSLLFCFCAVSSPGLPSDDLTLHGSCP